MGLESALFAAANALGGTALGGPLFSAALNAGSIGTGLSVLSAGSSIIGGVQSYKEGQAQSERAIAQGKIAAQEEARLAAREAAFESKATDETARRQKLAFLASGVSLEGSPLLVMEETRRRGRDNVNEILRSGASRSNARMVEGRVTAKQAKAAGRREFISGITSGAQSLSRLVY